MALTVTVVLLVTAVVVTANVPVVLPALIVIVAGTVAAALLVDKATTVPPVGAALARVTVPVDGLPPVTLVGLSETLDNVNGVNVRVAVLFTLL